MLIKIIDAINESVGRVVSCVAAVFALLILFDVVMRYVFHTPTRWGFDLTKQLYGFYFIMLGGYALRHKAHVKVDLLIERFTPTVRRWVEILGYPLFFFPFSWIFLVKSYEFASRSLTQGETTYGAVQLPVYPLKIAMSIAALLLFIQGISEFLKLILNKDGHSDGR